MKTINLNGTMVNCYEDGSVEFASKACKHNGLHKTLGWADGRGYLCVTINKKKYKVHRLIAMAFHENPNNLPEVDHIDRNRNNNKPENLRWVSHKENEDNKDRVDKSLENYGVRHCDDRKAYYKQHNKRCLKMTKPDGSDTRTGALSQEIYDLLKPLTQKERYGLYLSLREEFKDGLKANLPKLFTPACLRNAMLDLKGTWNNGEFTKALVDIGLITPLGDSKRFCPTEKWVEGEHGCSQPTTYGKHKNTNVVLCYNRENEDIKNVLNKLYQHER